MNLNLQRIVVLISTALLFTIWFSRFSSRNNECSLDALLVLGGGRPVDQENPPVWVKYRADTAAKMYWDRTELCGNGPKIITLSGGSAHVPQLIGKQGLPIFESVATARYLTDKWMIPSIDIMFETSSYDTIGNAFFARTAFVDVQGFKNICVITSKSHMQRTEFIFEWIFGLSSGIKYATDLCTLSFVESPDIGLSEQVLQARVEKEKLSLMNLKKLRMEENFSTLRELQLWLTTQHDMYSVKKSSIADHQVVSDIVKKSYGLITPHG